MFLEKYVAVFFFLSLIFKNVEYISFHFLFQFNLFVFLIEIASSSSTTGANDARDIQPNEGLFFVDHFYKVFKKHMFQPK